MSLATAYAVRRKNKKMDPRMRSVNPDVMDENYAEGGEVKEESMSEKMKKALRSPMGGSSNDDMKEYMPSEDIVKAIRAKKMSEGGMVEDDEIGDMDDDLYRVGESELHETPGHLMEDGEHEVEGMGEKEAIMKKGLMSRILGKVRLKNFGV